jgi:hypothetical protein
MKAESDQGGFLVETTWSQMRTDKSAGVKCYANKASWKHYKTHP